MSVGEVSSPVGEITVPAGKPKKAPTAGSWGPGKSGNPGGMTHRERAFRAKVREQDPARVGAILDALYETAVERGEKHVEAARLYLDAVGVIGRTRGVLDDEDMQSVPEEVLRWIAGAQSAMVIARQAAAHVAAIDADVAEAVDENGR